MGRQLEEGLPNARIAERWHLAEGTVRDHLSTAMAKLGAEQRSRAADTAREHGWL